MSRKKVYINDLSKVEKITLKEGWKNGKSHSFRIRCEGILLSDKGRDASQIAELLSVSQQTVYNWFHNWKNYGIIGLITKPGQGRKPILDVTNENHIKTVERATKMAAEEGVNMREKVITDLDLKSNFSQRTLRRFLQKKTTDIRGFVEQQKRSQNQTK